VGDVITVDGSSGVDPGSGRTGPRPINQTSAILGWADDVRRLEVDANADTPADAAKGREFGAQGIGLAALSTCSSAKSACRSSRK
jgi:pyruvate,orthophosphate dikinase